MVPYGIMKIRLHELEDKVEILIIFSSDDLVQFDDVGVIELLQESDLAKGALCVGGVLEGIEDLFECEGISWFFICNFPDVAIGATAYLFDEGVFLEDVCFYLFCHVFFIISNVFENYINRANYFSDLYITCYAYLGSDLKLLEYYATFYKKWGFFRWRKMAVGFVLFLI